MRTYPCSCKNTLFFDSTVCLECGHDTGMCPQCQRVVPLIADKQGQLHCGHVDCGVALRKCANYETEQICNRCLPAPAEEEPDKTLCDFCSLTTVIPDLSLSGGRETWRRLEQAKHRVLYILDLIGLPFRPSTQPGAPLLTFEFKADGERPAPTGHENGCITINIREADDVEREKARVAFQEPQRTLVGHFRHELGHYFWDRLVKGKCAVQCRARFGDERNPPYAEALKKYHENGPKPNWREEYISAYATMHPWEDFAETVGAYLDMVSVLDTASHFDIAPCKLDNVDSMIKSYQQVGLIANELNRDMGLVDLVPEVFVPAVINKLRFVHSLRSHADCGSTRSTPVARC